MSWFNLLILLIGIVLGAGGLAVMWVVIQAVRIVQADLARRRQTTNTEAGLLDTLADLNNVEFNLIEINERLNTIYAQVELAKKRQGALRSGPYVYPKDGKYENGD